MSPRATLALVLVLLAVPAAACGGAAPGGSGGGRLLVFAAASTTDAVGELARAFERRRPGVRVRASFAGSQQLASQVLDGAPADLLLSANPAQMQRVVDAGLTAAAPRPVVGNTMAIAVEAGNPRGIDGLGDLADESLTVVLAAREVPAGAYARRVLARASVTVRPDSLEPDARQVLAKVRLGEADAAVVYASDVAAADGVAAVPVPEAADVRVRYPAAVLAGGSNRPAARAFLRFLTGPTARRVWAAHGFTRP